MNKDKFKNTLSLLGDAEKMDKKWKDWNAGKDPDYFYELVDEEVELASKVEKAFYQDTKDCNYWSCLDGLLQNKVKHSGGFSLVGWIKKFQ